MTQIRSVNTKQNVQKFQNRFFFMFHKTRSLFQSPKKTLSTRNLSSSHTNRYNAPFQTLSTASNRASEKFFSFVSFETTSAKSKWLNYLDQSPKRAPITMEKYRSRRPLSNWPRILWDRIISIYCCQMASLARGEKAARIMLRLGVV